MFTSILKFSGLVFLIALGLHYGLIQNSMIFLADALYFGANFLSN